MVTHENILAGHASAEEWGIFMSNEDVVISYMPLSHLFEYGV